jgi:hypothetical protein
VCHLSVLNRGHRWSSDSNLGHGLSSDSNRGHEWSSDFVLNMVEFHDGCDDFYHLKVHNHTVILRVCEYFILSSGEYIT